jgi:hypothetical protein
MMPAALIDRLNDLQTAIEAENWAGFAGVLQSWAGEEPENTWVQAGVVVAQVLSGENVPEAVKKLEAVDARLAGLIDLLFGVRSGIKSQARRNAVAELAHGNQDKALVETMKWTDAPSVDPARYLFASPALVAGCVTENGQAVSMAARGSRMSADSLGTRSERIWELAVRMNQFIDLGNLTSMQVFGKDGGWALGVAYSDPPRLISSLVESAPHVNEIAARTQLVIAAQEEPKHE